MTRAGLHQVKDPAPELSLAARGRLRTLLELATTIGRREGLLGPPDEGRQAEAGEGLSGGVKVKHKRMQARGSSRDVPQRGNKQFKEAKG